MNTDFAEIRKTIRQITGGLSLLILVFRLPEILAVLLK